MSGEAQATRLVAGCRERRWPETEEETLDGMPVKSSPPARRCTQCGGSLSRYNLGNTCLRHTAVRYRTEIETPRRMCVVCGLTAVSESKSACSRCVRYRKLLRLRGANSLKTAEGVA